ncbi:MAG: hypothetical protein FJZ58_05355, partial [Chlamydiae bacterium]|nr:hypothetical protein [Chlamydiota bacterium]
MISDFFKKRWAVLSSLACFVLTGQELLSTTTYYVTQSNEPGTESTSDCSTCTTSGNTCCTFLDALAGAQGAGTIDTIILTVPSTITYTGTASFSNETAYSATIQSDLSTGTVINFNGQGSVGGYIFQPTFSSTANPGIYTLSNVVFQNGTTINLAGGSITLNGTATAGGAVFSGNIWHAGTYNGQDPSLMFGNEGSYSNAFTDAIQLDSSTTLNLSSAYTGGSITLSGDITYASGASGSSLNIGASSTGGS